MKAAPARIEHALNTAAVSWKWQQIIRVSATIAAIQCGVVLALGLALVQQWITSSAVFWSVIGLFVAVLAMSMVAVLIITIDRQLNRRWLAESVEQAQQPLMDRLNTLVELEGRQRNAQAEMFHDAIEAQVQNILQNTAQQHVFSWHRILPHTALLAVLLFSTVWFYSHFQPLRHLQAVASLSAETSATERPLEIPDILPEELVEVAPPPAPTEPWGEVRISEPGRDLRVTRHEDIPLVIEAAASRAIQSVEWLTAVNAEREHSHKLPPADDRRYAVHQPVIEPVQFPLQDWDVLRYRATATCEDGVTYDSAMYFIEIIPTRDELDELPRRAWETIDRLTGLIERQQQVIRQTARLPSSGGDQKSRRLKALAREEHNLRDSSRYLAVTLLNLLGRESTARLSESFDRASDALHEAERSLGEHDARAAQPHELTALLELTHARQRFSELLGTHSDVFRELAIDELTRQTPSQVAQADEKLADLVKQFHREAADVSSLASQLDSLSEEQQTLNQQIQARTTGEFPQLAAAQNQLTRRLKNLREARPQPFRDLTVQFNRARESMQQAAESLQQPAAVAPDLADEAGRQLQELAREMERQKQDYELTEGETLQKRLQKNIDDYAAIAQEAEIIPTEQLRQTVEETGELLDEMDQLVKQHESQAQTSDDTPETSEQPGHSELRKRLTPELDQQIREQSQSMCQHRDAAARGAAARDVGNALEQLSQSLSQGLQQQAADLMQQQIAERMQQMRQQQEGLTSAREFVQKTLGRQRNIQRLANNKRKQQEEYPQIAQRQKQLEESLDEFIRQNPQEFRESQGECQAAKSAMQRAGQSLTDKSGRASELSAEAAEELQRLDNSLEQQQQKNSLLNAQQVRQNMQQMMKRLQQFEQNPESVSQHQKQQAAGQCKALAGQCQKLGQATGSGAGGGNSGQTPLQAALSNEKRQQLDGQSDQLESADGPQQTAAASGELRQSLQELAQAFDATIPGMNRGGQADGQSSQSDSLRPDGQQAISRGLRQLESAARRQANHTLSSEGNSGLRRGGVADLAAGISAEYGNDDRAQLLLRQMRQEIEEPTTPVNGLTLQRLRDDIQKLQHQVAPSPVEGNAVVPTTRIDPTRFPADYRESIQKYFETLSEEP